MFEHNWKFQTTESELHYAIHCTNLSHIVNYIHFVNAVSLAVDLFCIRLVSMIFNCVFAKGVSVCVLRLRCVFPGYKG